jgi:hypothetical protein
MTINHTNNITERVSTYILHIVTNENIIDYNK